MKNQKLLEIEHFLTVFKQKIKVFGIVYHRSDDNSQTLLDLDYTSDDRNLELLKLNINNFYKGPHEDKFDPYGSPVWEFGAEVKNKEIYIKISLGKNNKPVLCKSFHFPKRKIIYPFK